MVSAVSWSWLINTCLISNFYGDGLNYVSIETDFLSYHMIWLRAQETKGNFSVSSLGSRVPKGRQVYREEHSETKTSNTSRSAQSLCYAFKESQGCSYGSVHSQSLQIQEQIGFIWNKLPKGTEIGLPILSFLQRIAPWLQIAGILSLAKPEVLG